MDPVRLDPPNALALDALGRIAAGAPVVLGPGVAARMEASRAQLAALVGEGRVVYGLNTGCGPLVDRAVAAEDAARFQLNLLRSHASGVGPAHPPEVVRATLAVRALSLAQGRSGVRPLVAQTLVAMLNADLLPVVPEIGSVGASGDLVELAHVARAAAGEGPVILRGRPCAASEAFRETGLRPIVPEGRDALALMNGTACETAQAALAVLGAEELAAVAEGAAALAVEVFAGSPEAFDARVHAARPHAAQAASAAHLRRLLAGSARLRDARERAAARGARPAPVQDAYTLRCIPQVLGAVRATVAHVRTVVEVEVNAVTDNPTFFPEDGTVLHAGNFHGQPVAMALDHLKLALAEVALFAERRLARLLDPATNAGLPPFLIRDRPGVRSGLMGLQYCASSTVAENAVLAHPASLGSVPTNANNQDVVGMGTVAARQARRLLDNARRVVAIELLAACEAADLRGLEGFAPATRALHAAVRRQVAPLLEDRALGDDVERLVAGFAALAAAAATAS